MADRHLQECMERILTRLSILTGNTMRKPCKVPISVSSWKMAARLNIMVLYIMLFR